MTKYNDYDIRMKSYEAPFSQVLPPRGYVVIRIDGKAFHTWTKICGFERPYDPKLRLAMCRTASRVMREMDNAVIAYVQSDEVSFLIPQFGKNVSPWLGGKVQKLASVSASLFTANFVSDCIKNDWFVATFDARAFFIAEPIEVFNYFNWRYGDCVRNCVQMYGQNAFSHKELQGKSNIEVKEMLEGKGFSWETLPSEPRFGTLITREDGALGSFDYMEFHKKIKELIPIPEYLQYVETEASPV